MLLLLSPAKSLDYETPVADVPHTTPAFKPQTAALIGVLRQQSVGQIAALMDLSDALAQRNTERYRTWSPRATAANARQALLAFDGDVYAGLDARSLAPDDLAWAQDHLAILSGLYGVLRPLDRMQPYRLEMGTRLAVGGAAKLTDYWRPHIARHLNRHLQADATPVVVNLASQEYFQSVDTAVLKARVVDCVFEDWKGGQYKVISFYAKRARGMMARHAVLARAATPHALRGFRAGGYAFDATASAPDRMVFRRQAPA